MKAHWKYIIISLIIGGFLGSAISLFCLHGPRRGGLKDRGFGGMRPKLYQELQLSPEQKSKTEAIIKNSRDKIVEIRKAAREDMRMILSPEQQATFDAHNAKMDARRKRWDDRPKKRHD